jgi:hypothetical protein
MEGSTMATFTGGCLCGRVRYSSDAAPAFMGICHCRNCQRFTGSAFESVVALPKSEVAIEGEVKIYQDTSDAGRPMQRGFCPNCGSSLIAEAAVMPGILMVLAGTLDDPSVMQPGMEIYCSSAQPWVNLAGERQRFPQMPG